ncbi:hypothetical protein Tco_1101183, partial [Tanacetum coccineum]
RRFVVERKSEALISGGQFVARLAEHFGLLIEERLQGLTEGDAGGVTKEALMALGGGDEDEEMPQAVPPPPRTQDSMARDFSRFTTWTVTSLARLMDMADVAYMRYSESPVDYQRRTRQRTNGASTSASPQ